ncbi:3-isopropylmalate dehydratase small subunit [Tundrisphaera sp. TA3]|uniref:3-isopropylmalate dehydratase small subunit n=1 Tax=Tundrisphaera sp. TA3 TaxID=3435775 RepID=UPI003EB6B421
MQAFTVHRGKAVVLDWTDVNTDLIIPARYLKRVERVGYGPLLFADKRYVAGGSPQPDNPEFHGALDPEFPLNKPEAQGATILVVGRNFGCGSSREHAVWAVAQAGFRALIAPGKGEGFADIFEGNAYGNGLVPLEVPESEWAEIAEAVRAGAELTFDLHDLRLTVHPAGGGSGKSYAIDIPEDQRHRLLHGLDAIAETLLDEPAIRAHEENAPIWITPQPA